MFYVRLTVSVVCFILAVSIVNRESCGKSFSIGTVIHLAGCK